jgi:hypothetical protein
MFMPLHRNGRNTVRQMPVNGPTELSSRPERSAVEGPAVSLPVLTQSLEGRRRSGLTHGTGQAIVEQSGVREGGANPPLPRNCKRREFEPICWSHWDANPGKAVQARRSVSQETGQMPSRAVFSFDGRAGKQPR